MPSRSRIYSYDASSARALSIALDLTAKLIASYDDDAVTNDSQPPKTTNDSTAHKVTFAPTNTSSEALDVSSSAANGADEDFLPSSSPILSNLAGTSDALNALTTATTTTTAIISPTPDGIDDSKKTSALPESTDSVALTTDITATPTSTTTANATAAALAATAAISRAIDKVDKDFKPLPPSMKTESIIASENGAATINVTTTATSDTSPDKVVSEVYPSCSPMFIDSAVPTAMPAVIDSSSTTGASNHDKPPPPSPALAGSTAGANVVDSTNDSTNDSNVKIQL